MTAPIHTRPFCAEHARAGAPYCCRNGEEATVLKWDGRSKNEPLIGFKSEQDIPASWRANGVYYNDGGEGPDDLIMLPLGYIDGKPVFVGDEVIDGASGERLKVRAEWAEVSKKTWTWPAPAKAYPQTKMTHGQLCDAYIPKIDGLWNSNTANNIANAALRHAIDAGQVVTKEDHEAALILQGERISEAAKEFHAKWADDADQWGEALNDAAWVFTDVCPEKSGLLFNTCKTALRAAILEYHAAIISKVGSQP